MGTATTQDDMFIRFSERENINSYTPSVTNTAGSQRLQDGTKIIGALKAKENIFAGYVRWDQDFNSNLSIVILYLSIIIFSVAIIIAILFFSCLKSSITPIICIRLIYIKENRCLYHSVIFLSFIYFLKFGLYRYVLLSSIDSSLILLSLIIYSTKLGYS